MKTLKEKIKQTVTLDDYVLTLLYKTGLDKINKDPEVLYPIFHFVFKNSKIKKLNKILFSDFLVILYSSELYDSLFRLEASLLLPYIINNQESYYVITDELRSKKSFENIPPLDMEKIVASAQLFCALYAKRQASTDLPTEEIDALNAYKRVMEFEEEGLYKSAEIVRNTGTSEEPTKKYQRLFRNK